MLALITGVSRELGLGFNVARLLGEQGLAFDAVINNAVAGFDFASNTVETDLDTVRMAFETNIMGPWRICNALLPLLEKSTQPRIVNVSSEAS